MFKRRCAVISIQILIIASLSLADIPPDPWPQYNVLPCQGKDTGAPCLDSSSRSGVCRWTNITHESEQFRKVDLSTMPTCHKFGDPQGSDSLWCLECSNVDAPSVDQQTDRSG